MIKLTLTTNSMGQVIAALSETPTGAGPTVQAAVVSLKHRVVEELETITKSISPSSHWTNGGLVR